METEQKIPRQEIKDAPHTRIYHTRIQLGGKVLPIITSSKLDIDNWVMLQEQTRIHQEHRDLMSGGISLLTGTSQSQQPESNSLIAAILEIPGVAYAIPAGYQIVIFKGVAFDWKEIELPLVRLLKAFSTGLETITFVPEPESNANTIAGS